MDRQRSPVVCPENEDIAAFMWQKRLEMAETPKGISDKVDMTLYKAYFNVCNSKVPIKSMKDLSQIKGVGKWILKQVQDFFKSGSEGSGHEELAGKGKKTKGAKRYVPQKNSVAYALLITLYRSLLMQLKQVVFLGWQLRQKKVKENLVNLEALQGIGTVDGAA